MKPNNFPLRPTLNGSEELYTQTNDIPQKFTLETAKQFITTPTDITYSELYTKVVNGELVAGSWYRLTDYKSVNFLNGLGIATDNPTPTDPNFNPQEIYTGETEVLLLQATSPFEIAEIGYSETFNGDIVQYKPFTNKISLNIGGIFNGQTLPDSSIVSGFDLQWDGTNVYFNMPTGYPALFGHYFYPYAEFDGGSYYQEGVFEPLTPNISIAQYPFSSDDSDLGYPKALSRIKVEDNGMKVILLDLTEADYLNYDADTLYVDTVYALGDAYGWVTRRIDTHRNIDAPFDFRGRKYRRFEVNLSSINSSLGTGYWGIGDNYLGQGTTGNYKDFKSLGNDGYQAYNIKWNDIGSANPEYVGNNDNVVFLGIVYNVLIGADCNNNTIENSFVDNIIGSFFQENTIGNNFRDNIIGNLFQKNNIGNYFQDNIIDNKFQLNNIQNNFTENTIGIFFISNVIGEGFKDNVIRGNFNTNTIGNKFQRNQIQYSPSSINFTSATHVYNDYTCIIFKRSDSTFQLSFIDGTNTVKYDAPNA